MSAAPGEKDDDPLTRSLFGLPEEDAAEALRRVTAEREALALEQSRMEQRFQRKNAARAAFVREALASTPALRAALVRSGAIDRDEDLGELVEQLLTAPLSDPDPRDPDAQSLHEAMATLRDAYAARRGDHSGYLGELAARRQALEKRQRDLLRETDRLYERQRELEDIRKDKARHAARMRAEAAELGLESSDYDGSTDDDGSSRDESSSERSEIVLTPRVPSGVPSGVPSSPTRAQDPDTPRLTRQSGLTPRRSASRKLRKERKVEYKGLFQVAPKKKWYEPDSDTDSVKSFHRPVSPFVFPEQPAEMKNLKREELVKRLVKELGGGGDKRRLTYVPAKAKDRLLKMKLAHMPVAARLKYLQSTESYTGETDLTTLRPKTPTNKVGGTIENMCRELAVEICDIVVNKVATQPTEWSLTESRREWRRQESVRTDAICRQIADSLVREICASEAQGIVAEVEAQYASSGAFVAKAIAAAVISRLDGAAVNELSFWEPEPDETPEQKARRKKREKERRAREKKAAKKAGGFFGGKKKALGDDDEPKGWSKPKKGGGDDDDDDFEFDRAVLDAEGTTDALDVEWSTSSSDEEDETGVAYETRVDRHACQLMLGEMQRRRPRGLVFHHTQPIREASPPPGVGRGVEMAAFAPKKDAGPAGAGDSESSTASDTSDDESEYDTSDEERAEYKKKLEDRARAAEADAVGRAHNPPRTGVANLGRLAEPPPPIHVHRVAAKAEARYWGNVRVTESFAGKSVLKTASAVTSVRAAPGRNLNLAAGTSRGEIVIWKFPGGDDYASDEDDENAGPNSPDKGKGKGGGGGWFGGGTKKGESTPGAAKKPKSRRVPTEPVVIAKAKLNPHPDREPDPVGINGTGPIERTEGEETSTDPTALYTAVTALDWSADGCQIASAERGGMSRMWTLVSAAKAGEKDKKKKAKLRMGETLWLAPVNHVTSSYPPEATPPPIVDPDVLAKQQKEAAAKAAAGGGKKDLKAPAKGSKEEMRKNMEEEERRALDEQNKRKHSRETWSHDAITIAHFFPAFTLGGRQPYAMFTRPNGDIVRTSPTLRPNVVSADGATIGIREVGTGAREIALFRGANAYGGGNAFSRIGAAKKAGKGPLDEILTIQSSESESEEEDADKRKRRRQRLDPSEHWASVPGQTNVAGIDQLLDAADNFKMGAGSHMGKAERTRLLSPDVNPIAPGKKSTKEAKARIRKGEEHPASDLYSQDLYRGHTAPVVFIDTLPDSASIVSVDADGNVCLWAAFQGGQGRSGFCWHSPLGQWRLPKEVTAQVPAGPRVQIHPGGARGVAAGTDGDPARDVTHTHATFLASFSKKGRRAVEAPKDKEWITADKEAAAAVNALTRHVPYVNKLKGEKAPGAPRLDPEAALDTIDENGFEGAGALAKKSGFVIKPGDHSDYFLSVYNKTSNALLTRHRQRFVTARAEATVVGAKIAHESGVADLVVIRRIGGICKAAFRAGGLEAAEHAEPYFTAHVYSLDDMKPTVPRMDLPNPFPAPPGRGWGDKPNRPKNMNGPEADAYAEEVQKGWKDPAPYPFVLAGVTPSLGTEHLIVPVGAGNLGVFSLASGLMVHAFDLPGVGGDQIECMETLRNPNPTGEVSSAFVPGNKGGNQHGAAGASVRALLVVATAGHKGVRIYALDEGAAQVARVTDTRAEVARMIGPPGEKKKKGKKGGKDGGKGEGGAGAGAVREGVDAGGYSSGDDSSGDDSDTEDSDSTDSDSTSNSSSSDSSSSDSSSDSDGEDLTRRTTKMSLRDDSPTRRAPFDRVVTNNR